MSDRRRSLRVALAAAAGLLALAACNGGSPHAGAGSTDSPLGNVASDSPTAATSPTAHAVPSAIATTARPALRTTTAPARTATSAPPTPRPTATSHPTVMKTSAKPTATAATACPNNTSSTSLAMVNSGTEYAFSPASLTVTCGGTVKIANNSTAPHTMSPSHGGFADSGNVDPTMTASVRFSYRGTFSFFCNIHSYMTGSVTVT